MINERTLPEHLDAAVSGASIDLHDLTASAQRDGGRIRRRQRVTSFATTSVLTAGIVLGVGWLSSDGGAGNRPVPAPPPAGSPTASPTGAADFPVPVTGRATVAALAELVSGLEEGVASDFSGNHTRPGALARGVPMVTFGELSWMPEASAASVPIQITVEDGWENDGAGVFSCADEQRMDCSVSESDSHLVVSYEKENGEAVDRFVDVWLQDQDLRVVVATSNAREIQGDPTVLLAEPPLSFDELRSIALDPVWGPTIPSRYVHEGRDLASFDDTPLP